MAEDMQYQKITVMQVLNVASRRAGSIVGEEEEEGGEVKEKKLLVSCSRTGMPEMGNRDVYKDGNCN